MHTMISDPDAGRVLVIHAAERLDFSQHTPFCEACAETKTGAVDRIDIDMVRTVQIYDSGIGMLLMLARKAQRAGKMVQQIRIINCRRDLRNRLQAVALPAPFLLA